MSVVERAGGPLEALVRKKRAQSKPAPDAGPGDDAPAADAPPPARETLVERVAAHQEPAPAPAAFDIDFDRLFADGFYSPDHQGAALAKELRAVKRRLLRRLGFLRAAGDRQAHRMPGRQRNLVLVTSTQAGEGKTFTAVNLAISLAFEDHAPTLLIDADIPRPKVRARLGLDEGPGLIDCLKGAASVDDAVRRAADGPFSVLGEGSDAPRAADLFAAPACQHLLTDLSAAWRDGLVIIDAPPTLAMPDAVILAKSVDEVVFVVEANETPQPAIAAALDELLDVNPNVSLVLNRCLIGATGASYSSYDYYNRQGSSPHGDQARDGDHEHS